MACGGGQEDNNPSEGKLKSDVFVNFTATLSIYVFLSTSPAEFIEIKVQICSNRFKKLSIRDWRIAPRKKHAWKHAKVLKVVATVQQSDAAKFLFRGIDMYFCTDVFLLNGKRRNQKIRNFLLMLR